ncbi:MAG: hypothetical protein U0800_24800 [Isosphaeraceae bacterium]
MTILALLSCFLPLAALADDLADRFVGEWKTGFGPVSIEKGEGPGAVRGRLIASNLPLTGKVEGDKLNFSYDENQIHVDVTWTLDRRGNSANGTFKAGNGRSGNWNAWRPDPSASEADPADFSGLWLTDLGLMELGREGDSTYKGRYALRGTSSIEGKATGRHLEFRIQAFREGPGWFDLDPDGKTMAGAGGTDGNPAWYGWKGRRAPEYVRQVPLVAGKVVDGSTEGLLTYCVRAPEGYREGDGKKWPTVLILHGSNMNSRAYVETIAAAWPDVARDFLLLGINGEIPSNIAAESPAFNYSYVNFVGRSTFKGFPGTDRESPALVGEAMEELKKVYPIRHYLVGGHSQGGYLTYSLLMNSPESIAGAFPISAGLIFQCEPSAYDDPALKASQRAVPLAIVHGRNDPLVPFDGGSYAEGLFRDAGWPAIRLFDDAQAAHMFARLPVARAIRWLETLASDDAGALLDLAEKALDEKRPRDAIAAMARARNLELDGQAKARLERIAAGMDQEVAPKAKAHLEAIRANADGSWVDPFLAFRDDYAFAPAAAEAMAAYDQLRAEHDPPARKLMGEARAAFNRGDRPAGYARAQEIVDKYHASSDYRIARKWLAERK